LRVQFLPSGFDLDAFDAVAGTSCAAEQDTTQRTSPHKIPKKRAQIGMTIGLKLLDLF
jgi:hypothetical protein